MAELVSLQVEIFMEMVESWITRDDAMLFWLTLCLKGHAETLCNNISLVISSSSSSSSSATGEMDSAASAETGAKKQKIFNFVLSVFDKLSLTDAAANWKTKVIL